jgi:hypothetical protein
VSSEHQHTETYSLSVPIPRDPSAYRITDHFRFRMNRRKNPSIDTDTVRRCIEEGRVKSTQSPDRFIFELELGYRWWVIVEIRDEAFLEESEKHRAVTVFAKGTDHDEPGWSV